MVLSPLVTNGDLLVSSRENYNAGVKRVKMRAGTKVARSRPEWAIRIERLRTKVGLSQPGLAERLGVSAMAVSRWERGINEPPTRCYLALGKLAGAPECWYFWQCAGLSKEDLLNALRAE